MNVAFPDCLTKRVSIWKAKVTQGTNVFQTANTRCSLQVALGERTPAAQGGLHVVSASNTTDLQETTKLSVIISKGHFIVLFSYYAF